jgi:hypothetical protein
LIQAETAEADAAFSLRKAASLGSQWNMASKIGFRKAASNGCKSGHGNCENG